MNGEEGIRISIRQNSYGETMRTEYHEENVSLSAAAEER